MTTRAAICIGVNNVIGMQPLKAAVQGAHDFADWARAQGCDTVLITDENGKSVTSDELFTEVDNIIQAGTYHQLVIYFSGHGIRTSPYSEFWLLTYANNNPGAAINLNDSIDLARGSGIPHVVFISDACRSLAVGDLQHAITGNSIFPSNSGVTGGGETAEIDVFYATGAGKPAWEAPDEALRYQGVFTSCLLNAVKSPEPSWYEEVNDGALRLRVVTTRKLKDHLQVIVPNKASEIHIKLNQIPQFIIGTALPKYFAAETQYLQATEPGKEVLPAQTVADQIKLWFGADNLEGDSSAMPDLSQLTSHQLDKVQQFQKELDEKLHANALPQFGTIASWHQTREGEKENMLHGAVSASLLRIIDTTSDPKSLYSNELHKAFEASQSAYEQVKLEQTLAADKLLRAQEEKSQEQVQQWLAYQRDVPKMGFETGVVIQGTSLAFEPQSVHWSALQARSGRGQAVWQLFPRNGSTGWSNPSKPASMLLTFVGGNCTALPIWPGMIAVVIVEEQLVTSVNYIPSSQHWRYDEYVYHVEQLESYKATIAIASQQGSFFVDKAEAQKLAEKLRSLKSLDPTLGMYAAYAYAQAGNYQQVHDIIAHMRRTDLPIPFDVLMLGGRHHMHNDKEFPDGRVRYAPFTPLLSQGWSLLNAKNPLHRPYHEELRQYLLPSLWSTYAPSGRDALSAVTHHPGLFSLFNQDSDQ